MAPQFVLQESTIKDISIFSSAKADWQNLVIVFSVRQNSPLRSWFTEDGKSNLKIWTDPNQNILADLFYLSILTLPTLNNTSALKCTSQYL